MAIDLSQAFCFNGTAASGYDFVAISGSMKYYIYDSCSTQDHVSVDIATFRALVAASEGASSPSAGGTSPFTDSQVTALKYIADNPPALNLSIADGALVSMAVIGVWATAWGFKALGHFFNDGDSQN